MNFSDELVYSKSISAHGNYKYLRIVPIGQGQNPSFSLSSTIQTQFELPNNSNGTYLRKRCAHTHTHAIGQGNDISETGRRARVYRYQSGAKDFCPSPRNSQITVGSRQPVSKKEGT